MLDMLTLMSLDECIIFTDIMDGVYTIIWCKYIAKKVCNQWTLHYSTILYIRRYQNIDNHDSKDINKV